MKLGINILHFTVIVIIITDLCVNLQNLKKIPSCFGFGSSQVGTDLIGK